MTPGCGPRFQEATSWRVASNSFPEKARVVAHRPRASGCRRLEAFPPGVAVDRLLWETPVVSFWGVEGDVP